MIVDYLSANNIDIKQLVRKIVLEKRINKLEQEIALFENANFNLNESKNTGNGNTKI